MTYSPFDVSRTIGNNLASGFRKVKDDNAIEGILSQAMQGGPEQLQGAIGQILSQVSPERQTTAINHLENRYNKLIQDKKTSNLARATHDIGYQPFVRNEVNPNSLNMDSKNISQGKIEKQMKSSIPVTQKVMNLDEIIDVANQNAKKKTDSGLPTTFEQEFNTVKALNDEAQNQNEKIKNKQIEYGSLGEQKIEKLMPDANDEIRSIFKKKGEESFLEGKTEGEISSELSKEARKFKNYIANVKNGISPLSPHKKFELIKKDVQAKIKPLLELGLYDTTRNMLSELGYYPEQREDIISSLSENTKKQLLNFPNLKRPEKTWNEYFTESGDPFSGKRQKKAFSPEDTQKLQDNMKEILNVDPSANLILLRKAYEEKGVDWDEFKNNLNDLIINGDVNLNEDSFNQLDTLEQPPLNGLEKILKNLRIL